MKNDKAPEVVDSAQMTTDPNMPKGSKRINAIGPSIRNAGRDWTPTQAREILQQTTIECQRAGLPCRVYQTTRGSVVVELADHQIIDGRIVPS